MALRNQILNPQFGALILQLPVRQTGSSFSENNTFLPPPELDRVPDASDGPSNSEDGRNMDDTEIRRLEDRIDAVNREGQLRLDAAMARIEGQITRIADKTAAIQEQLSEQRQDARALRTEINSGFSASRTEINASLAASIAATRSWGAWIIGTVIAVAIAGTSVDIGLRQVWVMGVQVGQSSPPSSGGAISPVARPKPPG